MKKNNIIYRILAKAGIITRIAYESRNLAGRKVGPKKIQDFDLTMSLKDPTEFYYSCVGYFDQNLAQHIKNHRSYFSKEQRGFGEDAFHVMWLLLVDHLRPVNFLEIGVYRGQVLSLVSLLQKDYQIASNNTGIGPFERIGDAASVKDYGHCPDWLEDIKTNISHFDLPQPQLVKALSTDPEALAVIKGTTWDMVYIDGNHDYDVVAEDWRNCAKHVRIGGVIVLDDSGLESGYRPPIFASGGFPGPSKIANSVGNGKFCEILQVGHNRVFKRVQ